MQKFVVNLGKEDISLVDEPKLECFVVDTNLDGLEKLVEKVRANKKLILLSGENAVADCLKYGADGVLLDLSKSEHLAKELNFVRKQLGDKAVGVISRNRRHEAMIISECEPDFVAFKVWREGIENSKELISWYNEMFLIQSAAFLSEKGLSEETLDCDIIIGSAEDYRIYKKTLY